MGNREKEFSNEIYEKFLLKYDQELADVFQHFAVHHCGKTMEHVVDGYSKLKGLEFADELIADKNFSKKIKKCSQKMEEGEDFAAAAGGAGIFEGLYERMLVISGKTGETDETLETIARQYEREIDQRMSSYIAILEPTLVIILSVIVGMILLSVILPLMGIMAGL